MRGKIKTVVYAKSSAFINLDAESIAVRVTVSVFASEEIEKATDTPVGFDAGTPHVPPLNVT